MVSENPLSSNLPASPPLTKCPCDGTKCPEWTTNRPLEEGEEEENGEDGNLAKKSSRNPLSCWRPVRFCSVKEGLSRRRRGSTTTFKGGIFCGAPLQP